MVESLEAERQLRVKAREYLQDKYDRRAELRPENGAQDMVQFTMPVGPVESDSWKNRNTVRYLLEKAAEQKGLKYHVSVGTAVRPGETMDVFQVPEALLAAAKAYKGPADFAAGTERQAVGGRY